MNIITILLAAISLIMFSCGGTSNEKTNQQSETIATEEHEHADEIQTIKLNNGKKWKVDDNMLLLIREMEKDISNFAGTEQKNYKLLANKLQNNIDTLTSNCTMEGIAHDELHKWLLPYIDLVQELSEVKDETNAAKQFGKIQTSYKTFNQYFQ